MKPQFDRLAQDIMTSARGSRAVKSAELTNVNKNGAQVRITNTDGHVAIIPINAKGDLNPQATWADAQLSAYAVGLVPVLSRKDLHPKTLQRLNCGYNAS